MLAANSAASDFTGERKALNPLAWVGRPKSPKDQSLTPGMSARLTLSKRQIVEAAIRQSGLRQSDWLRKALLHVAQTYIVLT